MKISLEENNFKHFLGFRKKLSTYIEDELNI